VDLGNSDVRTARLRDDGAETSRKAQSNDERVTLLIYHRDGVERAPLSEGEPIVIGRAPPSQVRIRDASLSREHARFTLSGGVVIVEDLGSTNGTWIRGAKTTRGEARPGDELVLGRVFVSIRVQPSEANVLPGLMGYEQLRVTLEGEVVRARYFGRSLSLLMVRAARGAGAHVGRFCSRVQTLLRPVDRMALYSLDAIAILIPEAGPKAAHELAQAIARKGTEDDPQLLVGVAPFPDAATTAEELLEVGWNAVQHATSEDPVRMTRLGSWTCASASERCGAEGEPVVVSPAMRGIFNAVARLSRSTIPVLLHGETGTGKEVVARAIHEQGARRSRPMVCVNCGAIAQQLMESTLFGHEKGAFTGASQQQKGVFEAADGGTVFLDEVGELPAAAQAALLRVLESKRVTRLGSSKEFEVDVRLITATHRDLEAMCQTGGFRLDLLYRLNAMTLTIPPLRARPEEIEELALRFLRQANEANDRGLRGIEAEALALLKGYAWPGNVRELRNAIERAVVIAEGDWITKQDLPERIRLAPRAAAPTHPEAAPEVEELPSSARSAGGDLKARLLRYEAEIIVDALRAADWNQTEAARALGMPLRTLVHKLKTLGIKKLGFAPADEQPPDAQDANR